MEARGNAWRANRDSRNSVGLLRLLNDRPNPALTRADASGHLSTLFHLTIMKPTFRPHRLKRARKIGYRARKSTVSGRKVLAARRRKGRKRLTVV